MQEVLRTVGLIDRQNDRIDRYSGGMKRRINIAVGLLPRPELLILDEPTVEVDPQSRTSILETLKKLNEEGLTILYPGDCPSRPADCREIHSCLLGCKRPKQARDKRTGDHRRPSERLRSPGIRRPFLNFEHLAFPL